MTTPSPEEIKFPIENWQKYRFTGFLGEGSMGRVYKAEDPRLNRIVALKFIRGDDPDLTKRLLHEAQAQAGIEHPHICKIYEVGEVESKHYIAMQYIKGPTLDMIRETMTLEQKILVISEVADAIHVAHRAGLIHRDLKPANILVENTEEGWSPFVVDFGLVRYIGGPGLTASSDVLGTPSYMAPEMVEGNSSALDRRTDVYALGATLHELLAGRPPFEGKNGLEVIRKLMEEEPPPLRQIKPTIPQDVETIVLKCLQKDPQHRYDSAKALSQDLKRFLDGEPIEARKRLWMHRLLRRAQKNKTVAAIVGISILVALFAIAASFRTWHLSGKRAQVAQEFGQEMERIETLVRYAYTSPIHDISQEKKVVRGRMSQIHEQVRVLGKFSEGPGYFALGRGFLALHEYEQARVQLQKAWDEGYRTPEVAFALGQTLGEITNRNFNRMNFITIKQLKDKGEEIRNQYRNQALDLLKLSRKTQLNSDPFVLGMIEFYSAHYKEALRYSLEASHSTPWLYEARKLEGDVYYTTGESDRLASRYDSALQNYEKAFVAYTAALQYGRSDPSLYEADCLRMYNTMRIYENRHQAIDTAAQEALNRCEQSIFIDPERPEPYIKVSELLEHIADIKDDPHKNLALIQRAIQIACKAKPLAPEYFGIYHQLGGLYLHKMKLEMEIGTDHSDSFQQAIYSLHTALNLNPGFAKTYVELANAYYLKASYEFSQHLNPIPSIEKTLEFARSSMNASQIYYLPYEIMAQSYLLKADYERKQRLDPRKSIESALNSLQREFPQERSNGAARRLRLIGESYVKLAAFEQGENLDSHISLQKARKYFQDAQKLDPDSAELQEAITTLNKLNRKLAMKPDAL